MLLFFRNPGKTGWDTYCYMEVIIMKKLLIIQLFCLILCGCLSSQKYSFKFDYQTGKVEKTYYDIRSQEEKEKDYSIERDWERLKSMAGEEFGKGFDVDVIKPIKAELFQDGNVLSGKGIFEVQLPKAFPSKKALLEKLDVAPDEELEFLIINKEIFLFFSSGTEIEASNGKIIKTEKNNIIVWPEDQIVFEFTLNTEINGGKSLLPFYLKEKDI
jgi:hypothetical protein